MPHKTSAFALPDSTFLYLVVAVAALSLLMSGVASADTLSLSISPSSFPSPGQTQLTVSAAAAPGDEYVVSMPRDSCSATPTGGGPLVSGKVADLPKTVAVAAAYGSLGVNALCGYLLAPCSLSCGQVLATAETSFTVTPSQKELEEAMWGQRLKENEALEAAEEKARAEAPAREKAEKATATARKEAEWATAEASAHNAPVTHLSVRPVSRQGKSSQHPGETELDVAATSFAHVTVVLMRHGRRTEHFDVWPLALTDGLSEESVIVNWTCSRPGGTYRYVVTANSDVGAMLTQRGHFSPVSATRCQTLKRREQEARERNARRYAQEVAQRAREERETLERYEYNCRAEGGSPTTLYTSEGNERACRSPGGGLLHVPY